MKRDGNKENLRTVFIAKLNGIRKDFKESSRLVIQKKLYSVPQFQNANVLSIYVSKDNEVGTSGIFASLWESGNKVVLAPRIHGDSLEMCQVHSWSDIVEGPYGLKEPDPRILPFVGSIDVVIVPGLSFDMRGARLGRGKGYYDRFLKTNKTCAIGLAYGMQIHSGLPKSVCDMDMDFVITEDRIIQGKQ